MQNFKYKTNNDSFNKVSKIYPYDSKLFANVFFHIIDTTLDADSLDDMLNRYDNEFGDDIDNKEVINNSIDFTNSLIENLENDYDSNDLYNEMMDCEDFDDEEFEEYQLAQLYDDYINYVIDYFENYLKCDMIFIYRAFITGENQTIDMQDKDNYVTIIAGVRFSGSIDNKLYEKFKEIINTDESFNNSYNDIRRYNIDILNNTVKKNKEVVATTTQAATNTIINYLMTSARCIIPLNEGEVISLKLDNGVEIPIHTNIGGFFTTGNFNLSYNLDNYIIDADKLYKMLDKFYMGVIQFNHAVDISYGNANKIELFKYDNKTCLFVKHDIGGTYLIL